MTAMWRRAAPMVVMAWLGTGCALFTTPASTVKFDRGEFALAYADIKALYTVLTLRIADACLHKKFDVETCATANRAGDQLAAYERTIRKAITDPGVEVDWQALGETMKLVVGLAAKFI